MPSQPFIAIVERNGIHPHAHFDLASEQVPG